MKKFLSLLLVLALLLPAAALAEGNVSFAFGPFNINIWELDYISEMDSGISVRPYGSKDTLTITQSSYDALEAEMHGQTLEAYAQAELDFALSINEEDLAPESGVVHTAERDSDTGAVTIMFSYGIDMGKYYTNLDERAKSIGVSSDLYAQLAAENEGVVETQVEKRVYINVDGDGSYTLTISYRVPEDDATPAVAAYLDEILADYFAR